MTSNKHRLYHYQFVFVESVELFKKWLDQNRWDSDEGLPVFLSESSGKVSWESTTKHAYGVAAGIEYALRMTNLKNIHKA
jgi:hypothetical protein